MTISDFDWLNKYKSECYQADILELGCGEGLDSNLLYQFGGRLLVTDKNPERIAEVAVALPAIEHQILDLRDPFPFEKNRFTVVLASLCLHYFSHHETRSIVSEINRILQPAGALIGRVNSSLDTNFGAAGYPEIEPGLFKVKNRQKRFFTKEDTREMVSVGFELETLEEKTIDRYGKPKVVWEFLARKT